LDQAVAEFQEKIDDHENGFPETPAIEDSQLHSQPRRLCDGEISNAVFSFEGNF
jgi:hypothetical protein